MNPRTWFYYHFRLTTGLYSSYENINPLKPELKKFLTEYEKRIEFFKIATYLNVNAVISEIFSNFAS